MDFFDLLFKLLDYFGLIQDPKKFQQMYNQMDEWRLKKVNEQSSNPIIRIYAKYQHEWYFQLICALAYFPIIKWVQGWMNPKNENQNQ